MTETAPLGNYSVARRIGAFLHISGQLAVDSSSGKITGDIRQQTAQCLESISHHLAAEGADWGNVLSIRAHLRSDDDFDAFDEEYGRHVPAPAPVRTTVTSGLAPGALVEIDALVILS